MHIVDQEDLSLLPLTKRQRDTFERIEKGIRDATRRLDEMDVLAKRLDEVVAKVEALHKKRADDAAAIDEFNKTSRTPAHIRAAAEMAMFRKRDA
jgi:hypothetical protein